MHSNLCILIEISVEIGMTQKTGIYWSCIRNCEFHFRNFTKIDRIFLKLQWKLSENCQFAVFKMKCIENAWVIKDARYGFKKWALKNVIDAVKTSPYQC